MKILVTGANGQLGQDVMKQLQDSGYEAIATSIESFDLSLIENVADWIVEYNADWVVNCAAYTQVDKAEEDAEMAFRINRDAAKEIARGVAHTQGKLLHISTDFVFDGKKSSPYEEDDQANPLSVYGVSKLEGELEIKKILPEATILRTAWMYGVYGHNFVKTMLRLAAEKNEIRVVDDQVGTPTWAADIAKVIFKLILASEKTDVSGTYHYTNEGVASWYDLACETISVAKRLNYKILVDKIVPIPTSEYPTPARRPSYSVLSNSKIRGIIDLDIVNWRESLYSMIELNKHTNS